MFSLICLVFAFVLACIAALWNPNPDTQQRQKLIAASLAFFFLACILAEKIIASRIGN